MVSHSGQALLFRREARSCADPRHDVRDRVAGVDLVASEGAPVRLHVERHPDVQRERGLLLDVEV